MRYADDFVAFCESRGRCPRREGTNPSSNGWPNAVCLFQQRRRGGIVHLTEGFDFLSFNIRHYPHQQTSRSGYKPGIKPSKKAVLGKVAELRDQWLALRGHSIEAVLWKLNPDHSRLGPTYNRRKRSSRTFTVGRWDVPFARDAMRSTPTPRSHGSAGDASGTGADGTRREG